MALKVAFDDPSAGWVALTIISFEEEVQVIGSYTPTDSFLGLINALHAMLQVEGAQVSTWNEEPAEVDLCFTKTGDRIDSTLRRFPDRRRMKGTGEKILEVSGTFRGVCMPFWRALRNLQTRRTPAQLREGFHREFPSGELDRLSAAIEEA
ncbi:MAG: hypothetical protein QM765_38075 [Myxococcales bacterium]